MSDVRHHRGLPPVPATSRSPWQRLYAWVLERRRRRAEQRAERLPRPTVSVGNLHWGGGGKTPFTEALGRHLATQHGLKVCILSRGYRRAAPRTHRALVVSRGDGEGPRIDAHRAGDEPYLLARRLHDVAVVVGARRAEAARLALRELPQIDLFLLDDGFSHVGLARDVEILLFPFRNAWGGGQLLPSGRLREPLRSARHADVLLLTGAPDSYPDLSQTFASHTASFAPNVPAFVSQLEITCSAVPGSYLLVSGVADAQSVETSARRVGLEFVQHLAFPDHHDYPHRSLARIEKTARSLGAAVLTTEKDAVKLEAPLRQRGIDFEILRLDALPQSEFFTWIDRRLQDLACAVDSD